MPKRNQPYKVRQGLGGKFTTAGNEPIDSPAVSLRMPISLYEKLTALAGDKKAAWIRQAIIEKLERDISELNSED